MSCKIAPKFPIGTRFFPVVPRGKDRPLCTVADIYTTTNAAGQVVKIRYAATHSFCGRVVTDHDVCETTIARGRADLPLSLRQQLKSSFLAEKLDNVEDENDER